jgi:hypothetical protein
MSESNSGAIQRAETRRAGRRAFKNRGLKNFGGPSYTKLVHAYFQSPQYAKLSPRAVKLLVDLMAQYRGNNNGDLTTAWSVMQAAGWRSKDLLKKAEQELERRGWIIKTRQGSINAPTLWAVTFQGIDDCRTKDGIRKLEGVTPDSMPLHLWKMPSYDLPADPPKRQFKTHRPARLPGKGFPGYRESSDEKERKVVGLAPYLSRLPGQ